MINTRSILGEKRKVRFEKLKKTVKYVFDEKENFLLEVKEIEILLKPINSKLIVYTENKKISFSVSFYSDLVSSDYSLLYKDMESFKKDLSEEIKKQEILKQNYFNNYMNKSSEIENLSKLLFI